MPTVYPLDYVVGSAESDWSVNPGACSAMDGWVATERNTLVTAAAAFSSTALSMTGTDILMGLIAGQVNGTSRFLVFRKSNIDEYVAAGTRTNRGTGYNASTARWSVATWGNQVIACNYLDATQSSTGAGFSALGGGAPKARHVASNVNFVMLADVDDSGSNVYGDMVWWSALRNPNSFTPSLATQAGYVRLLDTLGPITALTTLGDKFIAFKKNSIYVGQYVGPPYVFAWRLVSSTIGCSYSDTVVETDGKIFFRGDTGAYSFDGSSIENISHGRVSFPEQYDSSSSNVICYAENRNGTIWYLVYDYTSGTGSAPFTWEMTAYTYNCRSKRWSRYGLITETLETSGSKPALIRGTKADFENFITTWGVTTGFVYVDNGLGATRICYSNYFATRSPTFTTGYIGNNDSVQGLTRFHLRFLYNSEDINTATTPALVQGYKYMIVMTASLEGSPVSFYWNNNLQTFDGVCASAYQTLAVTLNIGSRFELSGVGVVTVPAGRQ